MMLALLILTAIMLAFTIITSLCAAAIARPRASHFGWQSLHQPNAGGGRSSLPSTAAVARISFEGGRHAVAR